MRNSHEELFREDAKNNPIVVLEHSANYLDTLFPRVTDYFVSLQTIESVFSPGQRTISTLFDVPIRLQSIGIGKGASENFVRDCFQALVPQDAEFAVWVDAMPHPPKCSFEEFSDIAHNRDYLLYWRNEIVLACPHHPNEKTIEQAANDFSFLLDELLSPYSHEHSLDMIRKQLAQGDAAYHVYVEYQGLVYDSFIAFKAPISLEEYQSKLLSTWRRSFEVKPGTTMTEAEEALAELVCQAKYQTD